MNILSGDFFLWKGYGGNTLKKSDSQFYNSKSISMNILSSFVVIISFENY